MSVWDASLALASMAMHAGREPGSAASNAWIAVGPRNTAHRFASRTSVRRLPIGVPEGGGSSNSVVARASASLFCMGSTYYAGTPVPRQFAQYISPIYPGGMSRGLKLCWLPCAGHNGSSVELLLGVFVRTNRLCHELGSRLISTSNWFSHTSFRLAAISVTPSVSDFRIASTTSLGWSWLSSPRISG